MDSALFFAFDNDSFSDVSRDEIACDKERKKKNEVEEHRRDLKGGVVVMVFDEEDDGVEKLH